MVVAPHVGDLHGLLRLNVDVEIPLHLFINPAHIPVLVSNHVVWHSVFRPHFFSDVDRVSLAPTEGGESKSYPS